MNTASRDKTLSSILCLLSLMAIFYGLAENQSEQNRASAPQALAQKIKKCS